MVGPSSAKVRTTGPAENGTPTALAAALTALRAALTGLRYPLALPAAEPATRTAKAIVSQLDDYLLPRLARLDGPLLVVVGGSTGAGRSTLINSLVRVPVSPAGVPQPTTRVPVLVCHPDDAPWLTEPHLLPDLRRTTTGASPNSATTGASPSSATTGASPGPATGPIDDAAVRVAAIPALTPGLALLDAPDIDSVVAADRALAERLLAAADLCLFVTTPARYADAALRDMLRAVRERGAAIALVLARVPGEAGEAISEHLTPVLRAHDLDGVPAFVVPEAHLDDDGLLAVDVVAGLADWLATLARSAVARTEVVRQTVDGAIGAIGKSVPRLAVAADDQVTVADVLTAVARSAYRTAETAVEQGVRDGELLRGEALARWQELVATGELMRELQARVGWLRDRVVAAVTGRPRPGDRFQAALESSLVTLARSAAADAAGQAAATWRAHPAGAALLAAAAEDLGSSAADLTGRVERLVRDWQRGVLDMVRAEAGSRRFVARAGAYEVGAVGLVVMIAVFTATSFILAGVEIVVAGSPTVAAQKALEAIFGDQAVQELAGRARRDLLKRIRGLIDEEANRYRAALDTAGVDPGASDRLRRAASELRTARAAW